MCGGAAVHFFSREAEASVAFVPTSKVSGKLKISCAAPSASDVVRWAGRFRPNTRDGILKGHSFLFSVWLACVQTGGLARFQNAMTITVSSPSQNSAECLRPSRFPLSILSNGAFRGLVRRCASLSMSLLAVLFCAARRVNVCVS